jgi:hypothetical protein
MSTGFGGTGRETVRQDGALVALHLPYPVDPRVSTPPGTGEAHLNVYLIREESDALVLDTGFTVHEAAVLAGLARHLPAAPRLSLFPLRLGEFDSVCNMVSIADRYPVETVYAAQLEGAGWLSFRPDRPVTDQFDGVRFQHVHQELKIPLGEEGGRTLEVFRPELRLLATHWIYDPATCTLFTSDMFTHARPSGPRPWLVDTTNDDSTREEIRDHLYRTRYWWLPGARTGGLVTFVREVFVSREITRIAPASGAVLEGADVVARHVDLLCEVLEAAGREEARR